MKMIIVFGLLVLGGLISANAVEMNNVGYQTAAVTGTNPSVMNIHDDDCYPNYGRRYHSYRKFVAPRYKYRSYDDCGSRSYVAPRYGYRSYDDCGSRYYNRYPRHRRGNYSFSFGLGDVRFRAWR